MIARRHSDDQIAAPEPVSSLGLRLGAAMLSGGILLGTPSFVALEIPLLTGTKRVETNGQFNPAPVFEPEKDIILSEEMTLDEFEEWLDEPRVLARAMATGRRATVEEMDWEI
ncbi:MAG: hypothetical protein GEU90_19815 [Gemmatimonas sp.]|nr:hypothetical protein [Gemmatimonas sp.]